MYISIYDLWMSMIISSSHHLLGSKSLQISPQAGETSLGTSGRPPETWDDSSRDLQITTLTNPGHLAGPRRNDKESSRLREHHDVTEQEKSKNLWWICRFLLAGKTLQSLPGVNILPTLPYLCPEMNHSANSKSRWPVVRYWSMRPWGSCWLYGGSTSQTAGTPWELEIQS